MQEVKISRENVVPFDQDNMNSLIPTVPSLLIRYISKMKGYKRTTPLVSPPPLDVILTFIGAFLGIAFTCL